MADFTKKAQEEGWRPTIRGGQVLYCMNDAPMGSRLSDETCLNETSLRQQMLAEEHQRQSMQQAGAAGCRPGQPGGC